MSAVVEVCASDYIAADDLGGKVRTLVIASVQIAPEMPGGKSRNGKKSRSVLVTFEKARKGWIANLTNQWSIALLLGTKSAKEWVGHRIALWVDMDVDIETSQPTACIRVQGSPDASPERAAAYAKAWTGNKKEAEQGGKRERGGLVKRIKREMRNLAFTKLPLDEQEKILAARQAEHDEDQGPVFEEDEVDERAEAGALPAGFTVNPIADETIQARLNGAVYGVSPEPKPFKADALIVPAQTPSPEPEREPGSEG